VSEAAALLGISKEAVRMRIRRGTLRSEKTDNTVYVWLDDDINADQDTVHHAALEAGSGYRELIEQLRSEVEAWREEARRKDTIIMNMTEAMKALNPPSAAQAQEPPKSPETGESPGPRERPLTDEGRAQEAARPRSWWRRMFGG
jgi:hypothetical protein